MNLIKGKYYFCNESTFSFNLILFILEITIQRFPTARPFEIINIIKRWFQHSKDRVRKAKSAANI